MTSVFGAELDLFRDTVRAFLQKELEPRAREGVRTDSAFWKAAAQAGLLGTLIPEEYGGAGADPLASLVIAEEMGRSPGGAFAGVSLMTDLSSILLVKYGTEAQKQRWFPAILAGEVLQTIAMTEPGAGSDAAGIRTSAIRHGDEYVINGSKCFICFGSIADIIFLIARTDPGAPRGQGMSVIIVPADTPGISRRRTETMGWRGGDTGEIFFDDVRVPVANLVGEEGAAFNIFKETMELDRLQMGARSLGTAELAFELTLEHARNRKLFGKRLIDFQNTQFKLAEMETNIAVGRQFYEALIRKFQAGTYTDRDGAMVKIWMPDMEAQVVDACLQLWGGSGFMDESVISRLYTSARVQRIYAGTTEIQKYILSRAYLG